MICSNCGATISPEDAFCGECGQPLDAAGRAEAPRPEEQGRPPDAAARAETPRPEERSQQLVLPPMAPPRAAPAAARKRPVVAILIALSVALLLTCACGAGLLLLSGGPDAEPTPAVAESDQVAAEPTAALVESDQVDAEPTAALVERDQAPGALLFADSFDDQRGGWDELAENDTEAGYAEEEYRLAVNRANYVVWANPTLDDELTNFSVEVDVRQVEGPLDNNVGLLVRYQPDDVNFYWFEISSDGYYSVDMLQADEWVTLVDWHPSEAINQGLDVTNHLEVVCDGGRFTFYVNGTYLTTVNDATFTTGNIGVAAGVFDEAGAVFHFDDVRVYALEP